MHHKKLYGTATVGTKGQVVIPSDAREELGIKAGDRLYVIGSPKVGAIGFIKEEQLEGFIARMSVDLENFKSFTKNKTKE